MKHKQMVTVTKSGNVVFEFVVYDDASYANFVAGNVIDSLSDYHGGSDWNYEVRQAPYVELDTRGEVVRLALSKVVI